MAFPFRTMAWLTAEKTRLAGVVGSQSGSLPRGQKLPPEIQKLDERHKAIAAELRWRARKNRSWLQILFSKRD